MYRSKRVGDLNIGTNTRQSQQNSVKVGHIKCISRIGIIITILIPRHSLILNHQWVNKRFKWPITWSLFHMQSLYFENCIPKSVFYKVLPWMFHDSLVDVCLIFNQKRAPISIGNVMCFIFYRSLYGDFHFSIRTKANSK